MSFWQAILLGVVQGLTEFLPVSSSGHLALTQAILGVTPGLAFDVLLHVATLAAVIAAYRADVVELLLAALSLVWPRAWRRSDVERRENLRLIEALIIGSVPAAVAGLLFEKQVAGLFASPALVGLFLWTTALVLLAAERSARSRPAYRTSETPTFIQSLYVGLAQAVALFPGVSRSGMTVTAGLLSGLSRQGAARFSFLLSIPVILGAGLVQIPDFAHSLGAETGAWLNYLLGALSAALSGYAAIWLFVRLIVRGRFTPFIPYLAAVGMLALLCLR